MNELIPERIERLSLGLKGTTEEMAPEKYDSDLDKGLFESFDILKGNWPIYY